MISLVSSEGFGLDGVETDGSGLGKSGSFGAPKQIVKCNVFPLLLQKFQF